MGLESSVAELGGRVDELEVDLLQSAAGGARVQALAEGQHALVHTDRCALEQQEVVLDNTVVGESAQRVDALLGKVVCGGSVVDDLLASLLVLQADENSPR